MKELAAPELPIDGANPWAAMRNAAFLGVAAAGLVEFALPRLLWPPDGTTIVEDSANAMSDDRWLAVAGLELKDAQSIAEAFRPAFPDTPVDYLKFDNKGTNPLQLSHAFAGWFKGSETFDVDNTLSERQADRRQNACLSSMGLASYLQGIKICIDHEMVLPPIDSIVAIDPAMHKDDTYMASVVNALVRSRYPGGLLTKLAYELKCSMRDRRSVPESFGQASLRALSKAVKHCPPPLLIGKLGLLYNSSEGYEKGLFDGVITPDTEVTIIQSEGDGVVKTGQSAERITDFFESYKATVGYIQTGQKGHADTAIAASTYLNYLHSDWLPGVVITKLASA